MWCFSKKDQDVRRQIISFNSSVEQLVLNDLNCLAYILKKVLSNKPLSHKTFPVLPRLYLDDRERLNF